MNLSKKLIDAITEECVANNMGFAQIIAEQYSIIIIANREMTPDQAAIVCAHSLLTGVVQSAWQKEEQEEIGKNNLESVN